jgi:hypothetical protein
MRMVHLRLLIAVGAGLLCVCATRADAQSPVMTRVHVELLGQPPAALAEGMVRNWLDPKSWTVARRPPWLDRLDRIVADLGGTPRPGLHVAPLTPCLAGMTLRFRW